jgi:chromosome segregation ATPase
MLTRTDRELQQALKVLNALSSNATTIIDDTFYAILEDVELISHNVQQLQNLKDTINGSVNEYNQTMTSTVDEAKEQLSSLSTLDTQRTTIEDLRTSISSSRNTVDGLQDRLAAVRTKLEDWEKKEIRWQQRTSRRFAIVA